MSWKRLGRSTLTGMWAARPRPARGRRGRLPHAFPQAGLDFVALYATAGGLSAGIGWAASEFLGVRHGVRGLFGEALVCGFVGGALGVGLYAAAALVCGRRGGWSGRLNAGLAAGALGGAVGVSLGHAFLGTLYGSRALGWALLGAGVGAAGGLYERSPAGLRRGAAAAAVGGFAGGLPFGLVTALPPAAWEAWGRAGAFLVLGAAVGAALGLAEVACAAAWLTVVGGPGEGRRLPLSAPTVVLGRAPGAALGFTARGDAEVDREHARIVRQPDGRFALEDLHSRHGTRLNLRRVLDPVPLTDGDEIRVGAQALRFNDRSRRPAAVPAATPPPDAPKPARPPVTNAAGKRPAGMSLCPKCRRPVPGTRPYCVVCKLSF